MRKRLFAIALAMLMLFSLIPMTAFADNDADIVHDHAPTTTSTDDPAIDSETEPESDSELTSEPVTEPTAHTHSYTATVVEPTCSEEGYTLYTCSCGDSYKSDYTETTAHKFINTTCEWCGYVNNGKYETVTSGGVTYTLQDDVLTCYGYGKCTDAWQDTIKLAAVKTVIIGENITTIDGVVEGAFENCTNLKKVVFSDDLIEITGPEFQGCTSLKSITFPKNLQTIGFYSFEGCTALNNVVVPDSVTTIGISAFANCTSLTNITLPDNLELIGEKAFKNSGYYNNSYNWVNGVLYIGKYLIKAQESLSGSYTIKSGTTLIAPKAFASCIYLTDIVMPDSVKHISSLAFNGCSRLTSVKIPSGVTSIELSTFEGCSKLKSVTIPASVTKIEKKAFFACNALTDVYYAGPQEDWNMIEIGDNNNPLKSATLHCTHEHSYTRTVIPPTCMEEGYTLYTCSCGHSYTGKVTDKVEHNYVNGVCTYCGLENRNGVMRLTKDGVTYTLKGTTLTVTGSGTCEKVWYDTMNVQITDLVICEGITAIGDSAFSGCYKLVNVSLPNSLKKIDYRAFSVCIELKNINLPEGLTEIGEWAFSGCTSLDYVIIPKNVKTLSDGIFNSCQLDLVVVPDGVTRIGASAFSFAWINDLYLPNSINLIDYYAFYNTKYFYNVYFDGSQSEWNKIEVCTDNEGLENPKIITTTQYSGSLRRGTVTNEGVEYSLSNGVLTVSGNGVCTKWWMTKFDKRAVKEVIVKDGITKIDTGAFDTCRSLEKVTIGNGVSSIEGNAFYDCFYLKTVTIGNGTTTIGNAAFRNCFSLTDVTLPNSVKEIGNYAFKYDYSLKHLNYSGTLTRIGEEAFYMTEKLESISLKNGLEEIGNWAFLDSGIKGSITIPSTVKTFGHNAFKGCDNITSVVVENGIDEIPTYTFAYCDGITSVTLPTSLTAIKALAFSGCSALKDVYYAGNEAQWKKISIHSNGNDDLKEANIHYNSNGYPFKDVNVNGSHAPFATAILWASNTGITTGYSGGLFKPDQGCTRAQVVTFLWRAAGSPEPTSYSNPFSDVSNSGAMAPYYKAILWAVEKGITSGYPDGTFRPNAVCTRAQFVTFLWRFEGQPAVSGGNPFVDVKSDSPFYTAILWAAESGVTTGYPDGTFRPNNTCTRAHVVTFIYRALA